MFSCREKLFDEKIEQVDRNETVHTLKGQEQHFEDNAHFNNRISVDTEQESDIW